jgi:hypothetical protein
MNRVTCRLVGWSLLIGVCACGYPEIALREGPETDDACGA